MTLKYIAITITTLFLLSGCGDSKQEEDMNALVAKNSYTLKDIQDNVFKITKTGKEFHVEGLEDKIVLLDLFATWCPPCRASAKNLSDLQTKYKDDMKVIGVLVEEDKDKAYVKKFADKYGANYSISNAKDNQKLSRAIASATGVGQGFPIPLMVMYYKGKYINHYVGAIPEEMIESDIIMTLKKYK